jgi:hypothetical protein
MTYMAYSRFPYDRDTTRFSKHEKNCQRAGAKWPIRHDKSSAKNSSHAMLPSLCKLGKYAEVFSKRKRTHLWAPRAVATRLLSTEAEPIANLYVAGAISTHRALREASTPIGSWKGSRVWRTHRAGQGGWDFQTKDSLNV